MIASNENFGSVINMLRSQLNEITGTLDKLVKQNWENLKIRRRG